MRVLMVDDNRDVRRLVTLTLQVCGYEIHQAVDGIEGIKLARELSPDVVVLDVMMPGMDGLEVCRLIKADPKLAKTRVVLLSARAQRNDIEAGMQAGADHYVTKPFEPNDLMALIEKMMGSAAPNALK